MKKNRSVALAVLIIAICAYLSELHFQLLLIRGNSMAPTYKSFTFVLLNKHEKSPERGDVVAFCVPGKKGALIKRVVGIPGDVLYVSREGLWINGNAHPDYVGLKNSEILNQNFVLSDGEYFVLGDNTEESRDSRYEEIGIVSSWQIYGMIIPQRTYISEL